MNGDVSVRRGDNGDFVAAALNAPLVVAHGTLETPEFQRQARDFAKALEAAGKPVKLVVARGYNHYEVGETIGHPYAVLGRAAFEMMKLDRA